MPPDTTDEERQEQLPEDNQTPFSPADPSRDDAAEPDSVRQEDAQLDDTHPATDSGTDIDSQQLYDEGVAGAAEASEPNAGDAVVNFTPPQSDSSADQASDDPQADDADMPNQAS
jgi:hypothetical protein